MTGCTTRPRFGARLVAFVRRPHLPWFLMQWLRNHWSRAYHVARFGTWNMNTREHWDDAWARHDRDGFRASAEMPAVRRHVMEHVPPEAVVLDVGCGAGELLSLLDKEKGCRCVGVDVSVVAIARLLDRGFDGRVTVLPTIPYGPAMFDVVVCTETLEHLDDVKGTVAEIARVVRPGGTVIISVPDGATDQEEMHLHRFGAADLHRILSRHFVVEGVQLIDDGEHQTLVALAARPSGEPEPGVRPGHMPAGTAGAARCPGGSSDDRPRSA